MSSLINHAKEELTRAGLFDKDSDYNGMLGKAVMELVEKFSEQGHSGFSAYLTLDIFSRVARFKTLNPISSDPAEWMEVSNYFNGKGVWQNKRDPAKFSEDGGKTWYVVDERNRSWQFKVKCKVNWFLHDIGKFIKYNILRRPRPDMYPPTCQVEECATSPTMDKPDANGRSDNQPN